MELGKIIPLVNIYGQYNERKEYWDAFFSQDLLKKQYIIVGNDLNFATSRTKIWGEMTWMDPVAYYFLHNIEVSWLCDIEPMRFVPTWRNFRVENEGISKRINRYLVSKQRLLDSHRIKSWISLGGFSNHSLMFLQVERVRTN